MGMKFKTMIPTFIPIVMEMMRVFKRNSKHDQDIKKKDRTAEKLGSLEHLMVRLEKQVQHNRELYTKSLNKIRIWLCLNSIMLIAILIKLFLG